jgi:hypothetical protein
MYEAELHFSFNTMLRKSFFKYIQYLCICLSTFKVKVLFLTLVHVKYH